MVFEDKVFLVAPRKGELVGGVVTVDSGAKPLDIGAVVRVQHRLELGEVLKRGQQDGAGRAERGGRPLR